MFPPEMALRHPLIQPIFQRRKPRPREGCGLAQGGDRVPIPKTLSRGRGGADCRRPPGQRPVPGLPPHSVLFLFCLQIERTGLRCLCPTAVFMAA